MEGKEYKGMKQFDGKWNFYVDTAQWILVPRNCLTRCGRSVVKKFSGITEYDRKNIFARYWNDMNWE